MLRISILLILLMVVPAAYGNTAGRGVFFAPTVLYYDLNYEENSSDSEQTRTDLDLSAGYSFGNLLLGGKYYNSEIDTGVSEAKTTGLGAVVGFEHNAFKLLASYNFLNVEKKIDEPNLKYGDGKGIILEIMYICEFGNWGFGPKLFYKNFTFETQKLNGSEVESFDQREETELLPFLAFYFKV